MPKKKNPQRQARLQIPKDYQPLKGSEHRPPPTAKLLGPADPKETFSVTIVLRRRPDGPPVPGCDYFAKTPLSQRRRLPEAEFAAKYGAAPQDIEQVAAFANNHDLKIVETHAARRTVVVSGTVAQMSKAFAVTLGHYQYNIVVRRAEKPRPETYRGHEGFIHVPKQLAEIIIGVFGLENRRITKHNGTPWSSANGDPPVTQPVSIQTVTQLYNFPTPSPSSMAAQTIAIFSEGGYFQSDLQKFFGAALPTVTPIPVDAGNESIEAVTTAQTNPGGFALTFAPGAEIGIGSVAIVGPFLNQVGGLTTNNNYALIVNNVTATTTATTVTFEVYNTLTDTLVSPTPSFSSVVPTGTPVYFNLDNETTQDICIAGSAATGANVAVYFTTYDQVGWVDLINRVIHPNPGDPVCSVFSSSFYVSDGDDADTLLNEGVPISWVLAVDAAFQDAALQGVTICIAAGDTGSNSKIGADPSAWGYSFVGDGKAHVSYPGSDPWVLSVGGTTIGANTGGPPPYVEYVWNDPNPTFTTNPSQWGTTGGGVSDLFTQASSYAADYLYQQTATVPPSVNDGHYGRGVPDVAANASYNSGYTNLYFAGSANWYYGNGTSAAAPLWAGLIAVINAGLSDAFGGVMNIGFVNPIFYTLGSSFFRDINPQVVGGPTDNGNDGITGYQGGPGWDACTGWGSPNGTALLNALKNLFSQDCYFIVDTGIYDKGAVQADIAASGTAGFQEAFFVVIEGFTADQLGISTATVNDAVTNPPTVEPSFTGFPGGMSYSLFSVQPTQTLSSSNLNIPQRFTYAYNVAFANSGAFPATPGQTTSLPITAAVTATVNGSMVTVSSSAAFQLINQPGPYMAGGSGISWLSNDVRVFQVEPGEWSLPPQGTSSPLYGTNLALGNTGNPSVDATTFIQNVLQALNTNSNPPPATIVPSPGGPVPSWFDLISTGEDASELDLLTADPSTKNPVYNFALARVRYNSSAITAQNVRAFFRLIPALSVSTSYDPTTTYRRWTVGLQAIPLYGLDSTGQVISIPCFAEPRVNASAVSVEAQIDAPNIQTLPAAGGEVDVYFGCWLDINQTTGQYPMSVVPGNLDGPFAASSLATIQALMRNLHQCLVVEIAYDPDPIPAGAPPSTSGPLAQRNLSLGDVATNP